MKFKTATPPRIVFEDTHLVVISKPAGLLSQGEHTGDENLVDWLRLHFQRNYVGLIHRLDRNTSGLLVVAKRSKSAQRLTESLQEGTLFRSYLGWVEGDVRDETTWRHFLRKDENTNRVQVTRGPKPGFKESVTRIRPQARGTWLGRHVTLVEFVLETGRSHQIRAQSAAENHALLGDQKYGNSNDFPRTALHSHVIRFPHPMSKEILEFTDPLPEDMNQISRIP